MTQRRHDADQVNASRWGGSVILTVRRLVTTARFFGLQALDRNRMYSKLYTLLHYYLPQPVI